MNAPPFQPFGTSHWVVLSFTLVLALAMIAGARRQWPGMKYVERALAILMFSSWPGHAFIAWSEGWLGVEELLPLHYCNVAMFACMVALWTHRHLACEMAYFFGLAGMLQGLLTPALRIDWPAGEFWFFFLYHVGGVVTAFYVVLGLRVRPRAYAVPRMWGLSAVYLAVACAVNAISGANFGFFCRKPPSPSLMDMLGPWPWYVGSLVVVTWIYYSVLDLPFMIVRRRKKEMSLPRESA